MKIKISDDQIIEIVRNELITAYHNSEKEQKELLLKEKEVKLHKFQLEDMKYNKKIIKALDHVIRYYSDPKQYEKFKKSVSQ